jgi:C-1 hydroxylase
MTTAENKALVLQLIDAWNRRDLAALTHAWSPSMVHHGRDGVLDASSTAAEMARFMQAFPDLHMEVQSIIAEDDLVATRLTVQATHTGPYFGIEPTGQRVSCTMMGQLRVVDGAVVEHWAVADALQLMLQVGILPKELSAAFS